MTYAVVRAVVWAEAGQRLAMTGQKLAMTVQCWLQLGIERVLNNKLQYGVVHSG